MKGGLSVISEIIGKNIEILRNRFNITQEELAKIIGVSRPTLKAYLDGKQVIDSEKLFILSKYFNKPFEFFLQDTNAAHLSLMFRADNPNENFDENIQNYIEQRINNYYEVLKLSGEKISYVPEQYNIDISGNKLTEDEKKIIEEISNEQRQIIGFEASSSENIYHCFEDKGIHIISYPLNNGKIYGVSAFSEEMGCYIFINDDKNISEERKIFSAVHEYGHLIFHRSEYRKELSNLKYIHHRNNPNEKIADYFAGCFLVPRDALNKILIKYDKGKISLNSLLFLKKRFNVSIQTLIMALFNYGIIDTQQVQHFYSILNLKGYKKAEPEPLEYIEKNLKFNYLVRELYLKEEITLNKVAELMMINLKDLKSLIAEWGSQIG